MQPFTNHHASNLFPARITRTAFLGRGMLLMLGGFISSLFFSSAEHAYLATKIIYIGGGGALLIFLFVALFRSILMPRLRDIGLHPAWSLLILVHALSGLFLLALLLVPTNAFAKRSYAL